MINSPEHLNEHSDTNLPKQIIWRRNSPYLYQLMYVTELDWPSLTIDWISTYKSNKDNISDDIQTPYNMILGTHTNNGQPNYLILAKVRVPNQTLIRKKYENTKPNKSEVVKKNEEVMQEKIQIQGVIPHAGEVNKVRHNPHQYTKIASRTPGGQIHIFNTGTALKKQTKVCPQLRLVGHEDSQGYAIEWNSNKMWHIAGGSYDGRLSVWDCNKKQNNDNTVCPLINLNYHKCEIEDVSYNKFHDCILASCDDNGFSAFWDTRDCAKTPFHKIQCHEQVQYGIQFSVSNEYNVATCGSDSLIKVWDIRNMKGPLFVGQQPNREQITQIQWSRESPTTIWAVSKNKAYLWDMGEQRIRFMHGGHRDRVQGGQANRINELCVNINQPDTVATVDANNEIHVFQPNQNCKI